MKIPSNTPLHFIASRCVEALQHPDVSKIKNQAGLTPLHFSAMRFKDAIHHPAVSKIKDNAGDTPLHYAASRLKEARFHLDFDKVKNKEGETPSDRFIKDVYAVVDGSIQWVKRVEAVYTPPQTIPERYEFPDD